MDRCVDLGTQEQDSRRDIEVQQQCDSGAETAVDCAVVGEVSY